MQPRNNPKSKKYKSKKAKKSKLPAPPESLTPSDAPSFSENEKKVVYWKGIIEFEKREALADFPEIAELFKNKALPFLRLNKKWCSVSGVTILGANVNYSDRLLFWEYTNPFKDQYLVVLEVIWNHDYSKSLISKKRVPALKALLATYKSALDDYFNNEKKNNPENVPKALPPMGIHEGRVVVYNQDQKAKMDEDDDCNKMHVGPAGAGKTLMQDRELRRTVAKRCNEDDLFILVTTESKKVLEKSEKAYHESKEYIRTGEKIFLDEKEKEWEETFRSSSAYLDAPSEDLVKNEKIKWKASLDYLTLKKVIFSDFEGLFTLYAKDLIRCGQDNFMHWLPDHIKLLKNTDTEKYLFFITANLKQVYHALMISAIYEKAFFVDKVGKKQCNFRAKNEKAWLWETGQSYKKYLMDNKLYHPAFSRIKLPTLTAAFMDEVHNLTLMQILNIKESCKVKVCVAIDHRQNLDGAIYPKRLPIMNILSQSPNKIALKVIELKCSERCPVQLEGTLNLLLDKTCLLGGGNPDPTYKSIECHGKQNGGIYWMSSFEEKSPVLDLFNKVKSLPDFVVITHEEYIEEVKKIVGPHVWVTTPEKAKGLEFDVVFVYRLFDTPAHRQASKCLSANPEKKSNGNHPKDGQGNPIHEPIMHAAYVALSRTKGICIVFHPGEQHQLVKDLMEMQTKIENKIETVNSPTPEHFLEGVIKRIENNEPSAWHYAQLNLKMDANAFALLVEKHAPKIKQDETSDEKNKKKKNRKRRNKNKNKKEDQPIEQPAVVNPKAITIVGSPKLIKCLDEDDVKEIWGLIDTGEVSLSNMDSIIDFADMKGAQRVKENLIVCKNKQLFRKAVGENNIDQLKSLITSTNMNPNFSNNCLMVIAAGKGHLNIMDFLLTFKRIERITDENETLYEALRTAFSQDQVEVLKRLFLHPDIDPNRAMKRAMSHGNLELIKYLEKHRTVELTEDLLFIAVQMGHVPIIEYLRAHEEAHITVNDQVLISLANKWNQPHVVTFLNASHNITNPIKVSAQGIFNNHNPMLDLIKCITSQDLAGVRHLIEEKEINFWPKLKSLIDFAKNKEAHEIENYLMLLLCADEGKLEQLKFLIALTSIDPAFNNNFLLTTATRRGDVEMVDFLLAFESVDPSTNLNQPLMTAIWNNEWEVVKRLSLHPKINPAHVIVHMINSGKLELIKWLDKNRQIDFDINNLLTAAEKGELAIVTYLLEDKQLNAGGMHNLAIEGAAKNGHDEVVSYLLKYKNVDPTVRNNKPIRLAVTFGHAKTVECLLSDERVSSMIENTVLGPELANLAISENHLDVLIVLGKAGVDFRNNPTSILDAAKYGFLPIVEYLLKELSVDPTVEDNDLIILAASGGHLPVVNHLLDYPGVDPSVGHNEPIIQAAENGHVDVVKRLLLCESVNPADQENAAIEYAVTNGHLAVVGCLLTHQHVRSSIDMPNLMALAKECLHHDIISFLNAFFPALLLEAVKEGNLNQVKLLITFPEINLNPNDHCLIELAFRNRHVTILELLLSHPKISLAKVFDTAFKNKNLDIILSLVHTKEAARSILFDLVMGFISSSQIGLKHADTINALFERCLDPAYDNNRAIRCAAAAGCLPVVKYLLGREEVDPSAMDNAAMLAVAAKGDLGTADCLLADERVDPTAQNNKAIQLAAEKGHFLLVQRLLRCKGVYPSANNNQAIKLAAINGHELVVNCLLRSTKLDRGANTEALRLAIINDRLNVVKCLLADGDTDQNAKDIMETAVQKGNLDVVKALCNSGKMSCSIYKTTALIKLAKESNHFEIVSYFNMLSTYAQASQNSNSGAVARLGTGRGRKMG